MKFFTFTAFDKHLQEAFLDHPSSIYGIFIACPIERRYLIDHVLSFCPSEEKEKCTAVKDSVEEFLVALHSPSLFSSSRILLYEEIEKLNASSLRSLASELSSLPDKVKIILSGVSTASLSSFYQKIKQQIVVLDLSLEKPWERLQRQQEWVIQLAKKQKKIISPANAKAFVDCFSGNFAALCSELEKWITFSITEDILHLSAWQAISDKRSKEKTGWEVSKSLVWEKNREFSAESTLLTIEFYSFIGQLRYQLKLGLAIAKGVKENREKDLHALFPNLRLQALQRYKIACSQWTEDYFCFGLGLLAELECKSRSGVGQSLLLDYFALQLYKRKTNAL